MKSLTQILAMTLAYFAVSFSAPAQIAPSSLSREQPSPSPEANPTPTPAAAATPKAEVPKAKPEEKPATTTRKRPVERARTKPAEPPAVDNDERPTGTDAEASNKILQLEKEWEASPRNATVIQRIVADDFIGVTSDGRTISKRTLLKGASTEKSDVSSSVGHMDVRLHGSKVAIVTGIAKDSTRNKAGKRSAISYRVLDTWMERNGQWQCIASQMTTLRSGDVRREGPNPMVQQTGSNIPHPQFY